VTPAGSAIAYTVGVVEADDSVRQELVNMVGRLTRAIDFANLESFIANHPTGHPTVLVLGPSLIDSSVLASFSDFSRRHPEVKSIAVMTELSPRIMQLAMRSGVHDVLSTEDDQDQLIDAIEAAAQGLGYLADSIARTAAASAPPVPYDEHAQANSSRVIAVYSAKGGAGKSVIACNLAVTLAKRSDRPIVLIDADLQFGDMAVMLKLQPRTTVMDAVTNMNKLDVQFLRSLLLKHEDSGLLVLPAPLEPAFADQITPGDIMRIIELCREIGAYVVIDTPSYLGELVLSIIEVADEILLVAGMDIPNIKNVKVVLQSLRQFDFPMDKIRLALNRANSKVKLDIGEVERTLGLKAESFIPSDIAIPRSVNKGVPVVIDAPKGEVTDAFEELANLYTGSTPSATAKKSRFF